MNREFIDAGIKLHVTVESKDALRKLEKLVVSLWHTTREQTREDEELNVHSIDSEIYRRIRESENEKEEIDIKLKNIDKLEKSLISDKNELKEKEQEIIIKKNAQRDISETLTILSYFISNSSNNSNSFK